MTAKEQLLVISDAALVAALTATMESTIEVLKDDMPTPETLREAIVLYRMLEQLQDEFIRRERNNIQIDPPASIIQRLKFTYLSTLIVELKKELEAKDNKENHGRN